MKPTSTDQPNAGRRNRFRDIFDPDSARSPRARWVRRFVLLGAAVAILFLLYTLYQGLYYGDDIPTGRELVRRAFEAGSKLSWNKVRGILTSERFYQQLPGRLRVLLFVGVMFSVLAAAAFILFAGVVTRLFGWKPKDTGWTRLLLGLRRFILGLAALGALCILYGFNVEPHWLEVTHVRLASPKFPAGSRPFRLVLFGDTHMTRVAGLEERLPDLIAAEKPDAILFAGDSMNSSWALARFKRLQVRLSQIAPTFTVKGNWDGGYWQDKDIFGKTGVHELTGDAVKLTKTAGTEVWLAGAPAFDRQAIGPALQALADRPQAYTVFLYHMPDEADEVARNKVDLFCTAHTHGGQIALPFYGALITYSKFDKRFERGLFRVDHTWMYVNRGIGLARWPQPRARFFARPELTVIEIGPESTD